MVLKNIYDKQLSLSGTMQDPVDVNANKTALALKEFINYIHKQTVN